MELHRIMLNGEVPMEIRAVDVDLENVDVLMLKNLKQSGTGT